MRCGSLLHLDMPHLVEVIASLSLAETTARLQLAHDYLVEQAQKALVEANVSDSRSWGASMKRIKVELPTPPKGIPEKLGRQNLVEIINQCATIERLLHTLAWAMSDESGFRDWSVKYCHPTTSSYKQKEEDPDEPQQDNDLVLYSAQGGSQAFFEVSDVASDKDGNGKEKKDLTSLRILQPGDAIGCITNSFPSERSFLVVSSEFAEGILRRRPSWIKQHCQYVKRMDQNGTVVLEVCKLPSAS